MFHRVTRISIYFFFNFLLIQSKSYLCTLSGLPLHSFLLFFSPIISHPIVTFTPMLHFPSFYHKFSTTLCSPLSLSHSFHFCTQQNQKVITPPIYSIFFFLWLNFNWLCYLYDGFLIPSATLICALASCILVFFFFFGKSVLSYAFFSVLIFHYR